MDIITESIYMTLISLGLLGIIGGIPLSIIFTPLEAECPAACRGDEC